MTKILSIDDSKAVHAFLNSCLKNVEMTHAYDGNQGLLCLQPESKVDLILLDWEMPNLDGIETLKRIRALPVTTPIIMLTSKNNPKEIETALKLGANEYVMKPFTPDILVEKIETVLGRSLTESK